MPRAGLDRAAVIAAAAEIADREGLAALTLARLAAALGVKAPSLYNHTKGLPDIERSLAIAAGREINARMLRAAAGRSGTDALIAVGIAYRSFAHERPGLYAASLRAPDPADTEHQVAAEEVVTTVLAVLSAFGLEGDDALHATRGLRAIIHGFVSLEAAGGFRMALDLEESMIRVLTAFADGLDSGRLARSI
jgi:AcrR family transcriptional regulator